MGITPAQSTGLYQFLREEDAALGEQLQAAIRAARLEPPDRYTHFATSTYDPESETDAKTVIDILEYEIRTRARGGTRPYPQTDINIGWMSVYAIAEVNVRREMQVTVNTIQEQIAAELSRRGIYGIRVKILAVAKVRERRVFTHTSTQVNLVARFSGTI